MGEREGCKWFEGMGNDAGAIGNFVRVGLIPIVFCTSQRSSQIYNRRIIAFDVSLAVVNVVVLGCAFGDQSIQILPILVVPRDNFI